MDADRFGSFDGRFLGISLELGGGAERGALPWLSPAALEPQAARSAIKGLRADAPLQGLLEMTSVTHELRHFHDFLLSPLGANVLRSRYLAAINGFPLLPWLTAQERSVPVPLSTWITMPAERRESYWRRASLHAEAIRGRPLAPPLDVPFAPTVTPFGRGDGFSYQLIGEEGIDDLIMLVAGQLRRAEYLLGGVVQNGELWSPGQLFEVNALLTQVQHLHLVAGTEVADGVLAALTAGNSCYTPILRRIWRAFASRRGNDVGIAIPDVVAVCSFALLGSCEGEYLYGEAMVRFALIAAHVAKHGMSEAPTIAELYGEWDEVLAAAGRDGGPTLGGVEKSLRDEEELAARLDRELDPPAKDDLAGPMKLACQQYLVARRALVKRFLADPDTYLRPRSYLRSLAELPRPAVRVEAPGCPVAETARFLESVGWARCLPDHGAVLANPPRELLPGLGSFYLNSLDIATDALMSVETVFVDGPLAVTEIGLRFLNALAADLQLMRVSVPRPPPPLSLREGGARFHGALRSAEQSKRNT